MGRLFGSDQYFSSNAVGKAEIADTIITGLAIGALVGLVILHLICPATFIVTGIIVAAVVTAVFLASMTYSHNRRVDVEIDRCGGITKGNNLASCSEGKLTATLNGITTTMKWNRGKANCT